ncbi:MAG TPA: hypothetical protein VLI72_15935 [Methylibium sp.]|nr:hypothetical protein [Methylibium sp.]
MAETRLFRTLLRRWWLALLLMGFSFVAFGIASLNLLDILQANLRFLSEYGLDAVREGALVQLVELVVYGYVAAAFYLIFKVCEKALVGRLTQHDEDERA